MAEHATSGKKIPVQTLAPLHESALLAALDAVTGLSTPVVSVAPVVLDAPDRVNELLVEFLKGQTL